MGRPARFSRPILLWALLATCAAALFCGQVAVNLAATAAETSAAMSDLQRVILTHGILPRAAIAVLAGASLGLSGLVLQRILRNPLSEPSTLGISAGAQLALVAATIHAPGLLLLSREAVAMSGGILAVALILALTWRRGLEPVSVVLCGMMVALTATAASAAVILANGEYMMSLFIWGGGSLTQQGWSPSITIAVRLAIAVAAVVVLTRPLAVMALNDSAARSLGLGVQTIRFVAIAVAVWLATTVTSEVGVIGFVGLAGPALATVSGARTWRSKLIAAPLIGAILLWLTDGLVQLAGEAGGERLPAGAATALLGGPLLLWLLPRLRLVEWPSLAAGAGPSRRAGRPWALVAGIAATAGVLIALALTVGRGPAGWSVAHGALLADLTTWRLPRVAIAAISGAMLAAAGTIIQRVTGNPLASPETLGVGTAAGVGLAAVLFLVPGPTLYQQLGGSAAGAVAALAGILMLSRRVGFGPERLVLSGIAVSALCSAVLTAVIATGNPQAFNLLRWLTGSTNGATLAQAWFGLAIAVVLLAPIAFTTRWLAIMPLGDGIGRGLGLAVDRMRPMLVVVASLLTAAASLFVGPLSFVGLIAPHLSRLMGLARPLHHLVGAIVLGAAIMVVSDWFARMAAFPYQLPLGLFAALISGPYLVYLLAKGQVRDG